MSKIIKSVQVQWNWTGDTNALAGFNIAITPQGESPNTKSVIVGNISYPNYDYVSGSTINYTFNNATLDSGVIYVIWVQAIFDGKDGDWVNINSATVTDDGSATVATQYYADANTMQDGIANGGTFTGSFELNKIGDGSANAGEVKVNGGKFIHPNGNEYTISSGYCIDTMLENLNYQDWRYIAFIGSDTSRFSFFDSGVTRSFIAIKFVNGVWQYDTNTTMANFTPNANDCIVAKITGQSQIDTIQLYANKNVIAGTDATNIKNWQHLSDTTKIDGGDIYTGSITANAIKAGTITANEMATGTITATNGIIASIDASKITTGTLDANRISAGTITIGKLDTTTQNNISAGAVAESNAKSYADNIQIGGRNYLLNSTFSNVTGTGISVSNGIVTMTGILGTSRTVVLNLSPDGLNAFRNKKITGSIFGFGTNIVYGTTNPWVGMELTIKYSDNTYSYFDVWGNKYFPTGTMTDWVKNFSSFTVLDKQIASLSVSILIRDATGTVQFKLPKWETGDKATDWCYAVEDIDSNITSAVNNVQVGGRNLLLNTAWKSTTNWNLINSGTINTSTGKATLSSNGTDCAVKEMNISVKPSTQYTLSVDTNATGLVGGYGFRLYYRDIQNNIWYFGSPSLTGTFNGRQSYTFTTASNCTSIDISFDNYNCTAGTIDIWGAKLEVGNKATDWLPAPEDIDSNISNVQSYAETLTRIATIGNNDTLFHFDKHLCSTKGLNPNSGYIATLRPQEGKFNGGVAVEEGTTNLLDTVGGNASQDWTKWSHYYSTTYWLNTSQYDDPIFKKVFKGTVASSGTANEYIFHYNPYTFVTGEVYTFSVWVRCSVNKTQDVKFYLDSFNSGQVEIANQTKTVNFVANQWQYLTFTSSAITQDTTVGKGGFGLALGVNWGVGTIFEFALPMLEKKSFATSYATGTRANGSLYYSGFGLSGDFNVMFYTKKIITNQSKDKCYLYLRNSDGSHYINLFNGWSTDFYIGDETSRNHYNIGNNPFVFSTGDELFWVVKRTGTTINVRVYKNGVKTMDASVTDANYNWTVDTIGVGYGYGNENSGITYSNCIFDELYISPTIKTDTEIQAIINSNIVFYDPSPKALPPKPSTVTIALS